MGTFFRAQITGKCCMRTLGGHHSYTAPAQESGRSCPFVIAMSMWLLVNWIIYFFIMFRKLFLQFSTYNIDTWSWHKKKSCSMQCPKTLCHPHSYWLLRIPAWIKPYSYYFGPKRRPTGCTKPEKHLRVKNWSIPPKCQRDTTKLLSL